MQCIKCVWYYAKPWCVTLETKGFKKGYKNDNTPANIYLDIKTRLYLGLSPSHSKKDFQWMFFKMAHHASSAFGNKLILDPKPALELSKLLWLLRYPESQLCIWN